MSEYIITDEQLGLIQDFANVCVEGEKLPRIVRCGDCEHYEPNMYIHFTCELMQFYAEPDGFCKWGERREQ